MLFEDIKHPLLSDFLTRITGSGYTYLNTEASSRLNDFIEYISSITADNGDDFAFYPLRQAQTIGIGNQVFGIGYMASGTNIVFPRRINWTDSGILLNNVNNCGIINFSGKLKDPKFQFRKNEVSIFYFLKHNRPTYETSLYRAGQPCPYFWFDDSLDNFGVLAPEFSTSDFRTTGTTYLYDEIYGGDKKGYQVDFSSDDATKYNVFTSNTGRAIGSGVAAFMPPPVSFYEIDNNENKFVCINTIIKENEYSIRSFFGRDYRILTGKFPPARNAIQVIDPTNSEIYVDNFFPRRMVIGAGVRNTSISGYDVNGIDHICAGILILKGDYSNKAKDIAENMAEAIGIKLRPAQTANTKNLIGDVLNDNLSFSPQVKFINYYDYTSPVFYKTYDDYVDLYNFLATMTGVQYINYGKWVYNQLNLVTGELRSPDVPKIINLIPKIDSIKNVIGFSGMSVPSFGSYLNRGVIGFVSGIMDYDGENFTYNFSRFNEQNVSGASGFYILDNNGQVTGIKNFPPIREISSQNVTGYISGIFTDVFIPFDTGSSLFSSGYFINSSIYKFPKINLIPEFITGYISGVLFEDNEFSGFKNSSIESSSGFFYKNNQYEFLPQKNIQLAPVTGFLIGLKSGDYFSGFYQNQPIDGLYSGVFAVNDFSNPAETEPIIELYFPTGSGLFSGFTGIYGFDEKLGFSYTGFFSELVDSEGNPILDQDENPIPVTFNGSSGFIEIEGGPFPGTVIGSMTGIIGSRNVLNFSGEFAGFENNQILDLRYGYEYSGFFVNSSGFLGTEIDPITLERNSFGTGILTGIIGYINLLEYINLTGFDNQPGFENSGIFSGFFVGSSGFSGINGNNGTGIMTGFIGSRNYLIEYGEFSGFSGFSDFSPAFLNEINADMSFPYGSGFSGLNNQTSGLGVISGLISTGKSPLLFGDPTHFIPTIFAILYTGNNINFYTGDFVYTGIIPDITGLNYLSGVIFTYAIDSGVMTTGDNFKTGLFPEIAAITYYDAREAYINDFDFNARDYIFRVEAYEGQVLESGVRVEINKLISGLKTDNVWDKIVDGCLMAGPRTYSGAMIPLKANGKTGLFYNFTSSDYLRASGLLGDGATKYIDTQHILSQEPTGSQHMAVYITQTGNSASQYYMGAGNQSVTGSSALYASGSTSMFFKSRASGMADYQYLSPRTGFMATSRFNSAIWAARNDLVETPFIYIENGGQPANIYIFANNNTGSGAGNAQEYSNARIAMYSIGRNIDLMLNYNNRIQIYLSGIRQHIA